MKRILDHDVISSFKEYFSHRILNNLEAYRNVSAPIYPYSGARKFLGKEIWASSYNQWVYNRSVSGAQIPSGIGALNRGQSGLILDFKNGRFIVNNGTPISGTVDVSVPDFNIYVSTMPFQRIVLENKFLYPPYVKPANGPEKQDSIVAPCIVITMVNTSSEPFELGGIDSANFVVQVGVLADKLHHLMGVQKIVREAARKVFPICYTTPLNEYNDLKTVYWDYQEVIDSANQDDLLFITSTSFRLIDSDFLNDNHPNLRLGIGTINISKFGTIKDYESFVSYSGVYEYDD